jgi:hypothetical protein
LLSKRRLDLTEVIPPGPKQASLAEKARTRLLNQVDEKRNPKTSATVDQLIAKYFDVVDVDTQTMRGYRSKYENHIKPLLGAQQLTRLDIETLDSFYSLLRTCRAHCRGRNTSNIGPTGRTGATSTRGTGVRAIPKAAAVAGGCANPTSARV